MVMYDQELDFFSVLDVPSTHSSSVGVIVINSKRRRVVFTVIQY